MELNKLNKIYISGIGGIGVSALAKFFIAKGKQVLGSDQVASAVTSDLKSLGVTINFEQTSANITPDIDLMIYSSAVPETNPERLQAKALGLVQKSYNEMLAIVTKDFKTISVAGTNGKSTTTAMIASILIDAELDPSVILGSRYQKINGNFRQGQSNLFLLESCEYRAHLLMLDPRHIILTNIEADHLDFFKDLNHIIQTFQQFITKLKNPDDLLVINGDDINIRQLVLPKCKIIKYGFVPGADVLAGQIHKQEGKQKFSATYWGQSLGEFELSIPGDFNVYNALAAISYCLALNIPVGIIRESLKKYTGIWRRFEIVKNEAITIISDYAHHPSAIKSTIQGAKEFFPGRRLVVVFQPHQHNRTEKLFSEFVNSFAQADLTILAEIYDVAGRDEVKKISSRDLAYAIMEDDPVKEVYYEPNLTDTVKRVNLLIQSGDIVLIMGAGDIDTIRQDIQLKGK